MRWVSERVQIDRQIKFIADIHVSVYKMNLQLQIGDFNIDNKKFQLSDLRRTIRD